MEKSSSNDPRDLALGCGSNNPENNCTLPPITLNISTTTGGSFSVDVESSNTVENLKKIIAKKLRVAKDRICLLHRERELHEGTLKDNGLIDESKIILIPNVETGLLAQRPENTVMQALESLNDNQVNDFLSGKTPLNLSMRLGDHMMLIQLQLSTVTPTASVPTSRSKNSSKSKLSSHLTTPQPSTSGRCSSTSSSTPETVKPASSENIANRSRSISIDFDHNSYFNTPTTPTPENSEAGFGTPNTPPTQTAASSSANPTTAPTRQRDLILISKELENLKSIVNSPWKIPACMDSAESSLNYESDPLEQSPIKSLSNLVSSPIKTTSIKSIPIAKFGTQSTKSHPRDATAVVPMQTDSIAEDEESEAITNNAKFTSCICKRLNSTGLNCDTSACHHQDTESSSSSSSRSSYSSFATSATTSTASTSSATLSSAMKSLQSALLHRTTNNPIAKKRHHYTSASTSAAAANSMFLRRSKSSDSIHASNTSASESSTPADLTVPSTSDSIANSPDMVSASNSSSDTSSDAVSTPPGTLAEASRSLTQTLRKLSKEVFTNKVDTIEDNQRKNSIGSGAVIESMKNHGKGIYSGTFSGTLNPALQDRNGRPKRDISTVIHILNDLLSATPHYTRGARICFEPTRSIKQASTSLNRSQNSAQKSNTSATVCSKCNSSPTEIQQSCSYGECSPISSELITTYCDKHKPDESTYPASTASPASPAPGLNCSLAPSNFCHCSRKLNFDETSIATGESSAISSSSSVVNMQSVCVCSGPPLDLAAEVTSSPVCIKCTSIAMENSKTKSKLEQLRLVMQQKKERREARKIQGSPYSSRLTTATATAAVATNASSAAIIAAAANDVAQAKIENIVEEVDTAA